jgi:segregation and condensation protein B
MNRERDKSAYNEKYIKPQDYFGQHKRTRWQNDHTDTKIGFGYRVVSVLDCDLKIPGRGFLMKYSLQPHRQFHRRSHGIDCRKGGRSWNWHWKRSHSRGTTTRLDTISPEVQIQRIEAILFLTKEPVSSRKLAKLADLEDGTVARSRVKELNAQYDAMGRAFRAEEVAGGFQFRTRPMFADWLRRLGHVPAPTRLSAPAMETLAVVAYRQPVMRVDVESIRGVGCAEILKQLMSLDFVRIGGRSPELGRPFLYATTKRFLEVFGLRSLDQLPRVDIFREEGELLSVTDLESGKEFEAEETDESGTS